MTAPPLFFWKLRRSLPHEVSLCAARQTDHPGLGLATPRRAAQKNRPRVYGATQRRSQDDLLHYPPQEMVLQLAQRKALAVAARHLEAMVIGADTTVVLQQEILGKPASPAEAADMLGRLSGRTHQVYTGFVIVDRPSLRLCSGVEKTDVTFRQLSPAEIARYVESGAAMDKAGAYGIQDFSAIFTERIEGCFYNVVGFPLTRFYLSLREFFLSS